MLKLVSDIIAIVALAAALGALIGGHGVTSILLVTIAIFNKLNAMDAA